MHHIQWLRGAVLFKNQSILLFARCALLTERDWLSLSVFFCLFVFFARTHTGTQHISRVGRVKIGCGPQTTRDTKENPLTITPAVGFIAQLPLHTRSRTHSHTAYAQKDPETPMHTYRKSNARNPWFIDAVVGARVQLRCSGRLVGSDAMTCFPIR